MTKPATKTKTKKVAARKHPDGSQQYESQKFRKDEADGKAPSQAIVGIKDPKKREKAARANGKAAARAFGKFGAMGLAVKSQARRAVDRTKKKPMGGK